MNQEELNFIKNRVEIKKEQMSREKIEIPEEKELVVETIEERMEDSLKETLPDIEMIQPREDKKVPFPSSIHSQDQKSSEEIIEEANIKLAELITIAIEENIPRAVNMALKSGNAYLIDKLRDSLADKYYQELKDKKLI
ncbi:MAG: hypothetical protein PHU82_00620 [Candidatus Pacebacteria bacterium]|jgi:hypothetical protein|nr:hypothetical protein [Candidatus Paceibacterota bacterium]MDD4994621.1 hypothetical protein [Candidatus Paceibacterota bacterium]MDD5535259.1 hypothetical protein [Candidatus Paceibacterota bacterium]